MYSVFSVVSLMTVEVVLIVSAYNKKKIFRKESIYHVGAMSVMLCSVLHRERLTVKSTLAVLWVL